MDSADADLDAASRKIRQIFSSDLEFSAQHRGRATATFWIFVADLACITCHCALTVGVSAVALDMADRPLDCSYGEL